MVNTDWLNDVEAALNNIVNSNNFNADLIPAITDYIETEVKKA